MRRAAIGIRRGTMALGLLTLMFLSGAYGCQLCPDVAMHWTEGPIVSSTVVCVGQTVTVTAKAADEDVVGTIPDCTHSYPTPTVTGTGEYTWDSPGTKTITVKAVDPPTPIDDTDLSVDLYVTVVEVASVTGPGAACLDTDVNFTATSNPSGYESLFTWSGGGNPSAGSGGSFTTKWSSPGTKTVTATCCSSQKSRDVNVIGGDYAADNTTLRYYCGAPVPSNYCATLTAAPGQPGGTTYHWEVVSGLAVIFIGQNTSECEVLATGGSGSQQDIAVELTYTYGNTSCQYISALLTALVPTSMNGPLYDDSALNNGFNTDARYYVRDQFGYTMDNFPAGETFENDRGEDWSGNDWPTPTAGGGYQSNVLIDHMWLWGTWSPMPQNPGGSGEAVWHHTQHLWVGSTACDGTGCLLETHTQQFYRDRGRHE